MTTFDGDVLTLGKFVVEACRLDGYDNFLVEGELLSVGKVVEACRLDGYDNSNFLSNKSDKF